MCGINGIWNLDGSLVPKGKILSMNQNLKHRGPDENNIIIEKNLALGHTRLSIIDVDNGKQPISNADKSISMVYNGEIYNYLELRKILMAKGYQFYTNCDTEVVLKCYEEFGNEFVSHLRGMFAIAIWDKNNNALILARDRLGQKPIYYYHDSKKFAFSSELNSLMSGLDHNKDIDPNGLNYYLKLDYIPAPYSIFKNIKKLPAAHILICHEEKIKINKYWSIEEYSAETNSQLEYEDVKLKLKQLLLDSVKMRLMSDVPLGAFLSGGVDSSAIVAMMAIQSDRPINTFSIGLKNNPSSELEYAKMVANFYGTSHKEYQVSLDDYSSLPNIVDMFGEPFSDSASTFNYHLSKLAKKDVTVALSGDGGDEIFAGYPWYNNTKIFYKNNNFTNLYSKLYEFWPNKLKGKKRLNYLSKANNSEIYSMLKTRFPEYRLNTLFRKDFRNFISNNNKNDLITKYGNEIQSGNLLDMMQLVDIKTYLADDINVKVDRMSMQNSLEVRSPLLDHKLVEYVVSLPADYKIKNNVQKYIFKNVIRSILPKNIINRKKQGFGMPSNLSSKMDLENLYKFSKEILFDDCARKRNIFNYKELDSLLINHKYGKSDPTVTYNQIWNLVTLELWFQNNNL